MIMTQPYSTRMSVNPALRSIAHIPMIYEPAPSIPLLWEYHVLVIDPQEASLPDANRLNSLGREGWALCGLLDERMTKEGSLIRYYFIRQVKD